MRKLYLLIDGEETFCSQFMNDEELEKAREELCSTGNDDTFWYVLVSSDRACLPRSVFYKHICIEVQAMHIQERDLDYWKEANDEEHLQGFFQKKELVNPFWMAYLESDRPHVIKQYLQMWQALGNYMSPIARKRLNE